MFMKNIIELETENLILRQWKSSDFLAYATLTSNKKVMRYFPQVLTKEQSDIAAAKFMSLIEKRGWGFWAVEEKSSETFIGYAGLHAPKTQFPFSPCVEIGWRMEEKYWKKGYVAESGKAILKCAFETLNLNEIVYFSSLQNRRAEAIMKELGMRKEEKNFEHPFVENTHHLSEHYLYKLNKQ